MRVWQARLAGHLVGGHSLCPVPTFHLSALGFSFGNRTTPWLKLKALGDDMKKLLLYCLIAFCASACVLNAAEPLRIFIRGGAKTHGPGKHDWPQFLTDWTQLLNERGAKATG